MRRPVLYCAAALAAFLLVASTAVSILSLLQARQSREQLAELSAAVLLAAVCTSPPPLAPPPREAATPSQRAVPPPAPPSLPPAGHSAFLAVPADAPPASLADTPSSAVPPRDMPAVAPLRETAPSGPESDLALQREMAAGLRCFGEARYAEARTRFAEVLARQPENTGARSWYAASLYRANPGASDGRAEIERHLRQVLREQPEDTRALELSGLVSAEQEHWAEALVFFQRALELKPGNPEWLRMAGLCAWYGGDPGTAEGYFQGALSQDGASVETWHHLALARERIGRTEEAAAGYLRCLELDPGFLQARLRAGLLLLKLGRLQEARVQLQEHVRCRPGVEGLTALGDCLQGLGEERQAEGLWRRALQRMAPPSPQERREAAELYLRLSRAAWQRRDGGQSLALAEQGLRCEPLPMLRAYQGLGCLAAGKPARGRALLQSLLEEHPGSEAASLAAKALAGEWL